MQHKNASSKILRYYYATKHCCCLKHEVNNKQFSLTSFFLNNCPTAVEFPNISNFSRQLITLYNTWILQMQDFFGNGESRIFTGHQPCLSPQEQRQ